MSEPVRKIKAPVHLEYTVTAGQVLSRFLAGCVEGRLLARRCPSCTKVYIPPKGVCPVCAVPCVEEVPVSDSGTVTTFCIVNVPFEGQTMKLPYVYGAILLDGSDIPLLHLIQVPAEEARMGMRVKAEWYPPAERKPSLEAIKWFAPSGEPDAAYDSYKEHL